MRKLLILLILIFFGLFCCLPIFEGINLFGFLVVPNYKEIKETNINLDESISKLVNLNEIEFEKSKKDLEKSILDYQRAKKEYNELQEIVNQNQSNVDISLVDIYDVDFLWTTIGNYGTEEGITLKFDIAKSLTKKSNSVDYTICDLKFTISGDYIPITDFIYDLEDDSKLGFEISQFAMAKGAENLQATFVVNDVPINNENLTQFTKSVEVTNENNKNSNNNKNNNSNKNNTNTNTSKS